MLAEQTLINAAVITVRRHVERRSAGRFVFNVG